MSAPTSSTAFSSDPSAQTSSVAKIYRMVMDKHICPYGLKAKALLEREGYEVEDHHLRTREETDEFKREHDVETTPQIFIDGERVGGYEETRQHFDKESGDEEDETTYQPVIAIFGVAALLALATSWYAFGEIAPLRSLELWIGFAMTLLGLQKIKDVESFSLSFLNYDRLAQRWVPYASVYPFAEAGAGILMVAGALTWLAAPVALFIGTIGAYSVFKAVYIEKRDLKCACVGGGSNVPLGFVSLTENLMMMTMALWMGGKLFVS